MSLNCPHAWEEYKKFDTAYDALRREYLALRAEQSSDNSNEFKNVPKGWLEKMRELRGRCLALDEGKKSFLQEFDENYSTEVPEDTKLAILQNKIENNIKLGKRDLRFLYSIGGWPSDKTKKSLNDIIQIRNNRKDLSEIFDCREDQISFSQDEYDKGKDIICHFSDLDLCHETIPDNLKLPKYVSGKVYLNGLLSAKGLILPKFIGGSLFLNSLISSEGLVLPERVGHSLSFRSLINAEDLDFSNCKVRRTILLPKSEAGKFCAKYPNLAREIICP